MATDFYTNMETLVDTLHASRQVPFLHSAPGNGKSTFARALASRGSVAYGGARHTVSPTFIELRLGGRDPRDLIGIPVRSSAVVEGMMWNTTEDTVPRWALTVAEAAADGSIVYVLVDEVTHAPQDVQLAFQDVILDYRLPNGFTLPPSTRFILAGNLRSDVAGVHDMVESLSARVSHLDFTPPLADWLARMSGGGFAGEEVSPEVASARRLIADYLTEHPEYAYDETADRTGPWANRRSWTRLADVIATLGIDSPLLPRAISAGIGPVIGGAFIDSAIAAMPLPEDLLSGKDSVRGLDGVQATVALNRAIDHAARVGGQDLLDAVTMCNTTAALGGPYVDAAVAAAARLPKPLLAAGMGAVFTDDGFGGVRFDDALRRAVAPA